MQLLPPTVRFSASEHLAPPLLPSFPVTLPQAPPPFETTSVWPPASSPTGDRQDMQLPWKQD